MGSELTHLLEKEARTETDAVLAEARARADEILAAARREAEEIAAATRHRLDGERAQARARATSTASLRAAAVVLAAKDESIRKVFAQAEAELKKAAADPARRRSMIRNLLEEAAQGAHPAGSQGAHPAGSQGAHPAGSQGAPPGHAAGPTVRRVTVEVGPGDAQAAREAYKALGLDADVRETDQVVDGVRLLSADGRAIVENTLPSRLARARREMVSRVAEILWGA